MRELSPEWLPRTSSGSIGTGGGSAATRVASAAAACFATRGETSFGGFALEASGMRSTATRSAEVDTARRGICFKPMRAVMPSGSMKVTAAQLGSDSFSLSRLSVTFWSKVRINT